MSGEPAWADGQLSVIVPAADWQAGNRSPTNESKSASLGTRDSRRLPRLEVMLGGGPTRRHFNCRGVAA